jgi:hypothetical protein
MIIDLDAHMGYSNLIPSRILTYHHSNGHERDFTGDENTFIFDMYQSPNYPNDPEAMRGISKGISLNLHMKVSFLLMPVSTP